MGNMKIATFFKRRPSAKQRQYEILRAIYSDIKSEKWVLKKFRISRRYLQKIKKKTQQMLDAGNTPFFSEKKEVSKKRHVEPSTQETIIALRKRNQSVEDIKAHLDGKSTKKLSISTIHRVLRDEGFDRLPKRTRAEKRGQKTTTDTPPSSAAFDPQDVKEFTSVLGSSGLILLPLIHKLKIVDAITAAGFPGTQVISNVSYILSLLALKLTGNHRWSHDENWAFDRGLGLFAGLNVLPKSSSLSAYSYKVSREMNRKLLCSLAKIFTSDTEEGVFNLDFKAIPHWGDDSVLSKHWCGTRSKALKSILAVIVQDPDSGLISYTDAEINKGESNDCVLEFVDFWMEARGKTPKMLVFDSKFTCYENLSKLNKDDIKFITLRRRGKKLKDYARRIPEDQWRYVKIEGTRTHNQVRVFEEKITLRGYEGELRQIIITNNGREEPAFLVLNDNEMPAEQVIRQYGRRWLVEKEISEQVSFFHLNSPSSSIVIKVDFDLTLSLLAHNLYRTLASRLPGFEHCEAPSLFRKFLETIARVQVEGQTATIFLKKKTHMPILFETDFMKQTTFIPWLKMNLRYAIDTVC